MRKLVDSLVLIARGGVQPREVALAVFLGLLAGFITGWNASLVLLVLVMAASNATTRVLAQTSALGTALSWGLAPVTCHLGYLLLERTALGVWLGPHATSLAVVLFDLDRYTLVGSAVLAVSLGLPAAFAAAYLTRRLQVHSEQAGGNPRLCGPGTLTFVQRGMLWLVYGRQSFAMAAAAPRWLRPGGGPIFMAGTMLVAMITWFGGPHLMGRLLLERLSEANQAQVEAANVRISLTDGLVEISDMRLADPDHLERDRLRVGHLTAVIDPAALVRGRVDIKRALLEGLETDMPRAVRARPYDVALAGFAADATTNDASDSAADTPDPSAFALAENLDGWPTLAPRLASLRELVAQIERLADRDAHASVDERGPAGYAPPSLVALRQMHCSFGRPQQPQIVVKALRAKGIPPSWGLGDGAVVELANLSSNPALVGQPTKVEISASDMALSLSTELHLHQGERRHAVHLHVANLDIASAIAPAQAAHGVAVLAGRMTINGQGWITSKRLELPLQAELHDLDLQVAEAQRPADVTDQAWNGGRNHFSQLFATTVLEGSWDSPQLRLDPAILANQYKAALLASRESSPAIPAAAEAMSVRATESPSNRAGTLVQADDAVLTPISVSSQDSPAAAATTPPHAVPAHVADSPGQPGAKVDRYASRRSGANTVPADGAERPLAQIAVPTQETIDPQTVPQQAKISGGRGEPAAGEHLPTPSEHIAPASVEPAPPAPVASELRYPGRPVAAARIVGAERPATHEAQALEPPEADTPQKQTLRLPASRTTTHGSPSASHPSVRPEAPATAVSPVQPKAPRTQVTVRSNEPPAAPRPSVAAAEPPATVIGQVPPPIGFNIGYDGDPAPSPQQFAVPPASRSSASEPMASRPRTNGPDESAWPWNVQDRTPPGDSFAEAPNATATDQPFELARAHQAPQGRPAYGVDEQDAAAEQNAPAEPTSRLSRWSHSVTSGFKQLLPRSWGPSQAEAERAPEGEQQDELLPSQMAEGPEPPLVAERPRPQSHMEQPLDGQRQSPPQADYESGFNPAMNAPQEGDGDSGQDQPRAEEPPRWYQFWR